MATNAACGRIGVTTRVLEDSGCPEPRDALAHDWADYMAFVLPGVNWMPVPNLGSAVLEFADGWQLDGLILSGGNDIGQSSLRDTTEKLLLERFTAAGWPVLGICRGLQLLQTSLGGKLEKCDAATHVSQRHEVNIAEDPSGGHWGGKRMVNSYHRFGIRVPELQAPLQALALTHDGWVEAARLENSAVLGLMWHPERDAPYSLRDREMIQWLFGHGGL
jgi:gamma-glutamyl-gamma-aminobutyrate hydrolase PuuD